MFQSSGSKTVYCNEFNSPPTSYYTVHIHLIIRHHHGLILVLNFASVLFVLHAGSRRDGQGCRSRSRSRSHSSESSGLSSSPDLQERSYRRKYRKEDWPHDETRSVANPELGSRSKLQPKGNFFFFRICIFQ